MAGEDTASSSDIAPMKRVWYFLVLLAQISYGQDFVRVMDGHFYQGASPYKFLGANYWYGMYLGSDTELGDKDRLKRELDHLESLGVNNLRVLASSEGSGMYQVIPTLLNEGRDYNEKLFIGIDYLLNELRKRDMTAVMVLNNFWMWSGGMPQYVSWAEGTNVPLPDIENGGSWDPFISYSLKFFENEEAQKTYLKHLKKILNRRNTLTGLKYKNDPTILSWQLANEPRAYGKQQQYRAWIERTSSYLKKKDKNHMVSLGAEGNTGSDWAGIDLALDNQFATIDYATVHLWIQNWGWFDPEKKSSFDLSIDKASSYIEDQLLKAEKLGKPIVIEEFGVSRDNGDFTPEATTNFRDRFYQFVFDAAYENMLTDGPIQGCNFWSWGGEGSPANPGGIWSQEDDLTGDPPHERQGWYSVYDFDASTLAIIKKSASKINELTK